LSTISYLLCQLFHHVMVMKVLLNAAELPAEVLVAPASEDEPEVAFADGTEASADVAVPVAVAEAADVAFAAEAVCSLVPESGSASLSVAQGVTQAC
jgi:hypothetical protein